MKGIMAARTKPLTVVEPIAVDGFGQYNSFENPIAKQAVKLFDAQNAAQLIDALKNEAKVI